MAGGEYVDVEIKEVNNKDKLKVKIVNLHTRKLPTQPQITPDVTWDVSATRCNTILNSHSGEKAVERMLKNLEEHRSTLQYRFEVAQATLSSLRERPRQREQLGRNVAFTCSNCHYKGHRVTTCRQPPCQGFFECGMAVLHKEHREEIKKAEAEVKEVSKMLKQNKEEITNTTLLKDRTRTNFFAVVRTRLQSCNPIKYSNRVFLDNDLRVLAAACKHKIPADGANLEEIIENHKRNAAPLRPLENTVHDLNHNEWQKSPGRPGIFQEKFSPPVNNYFTRSYYVNNNNSPSNFNYRGRHSNYSPSPRPYGARGWHRGGRVLSPPTRDWSNYPNSWDSLPICSRSPSILADKQPRKRLNYTNSIPKPSKKSKESLGKEYRRNLIDKLPKQQVPSSSTVTINPVSWSTPKKDSRELTDGKSPEVLAESPHLVLENGNNDTQPFDYYSWSKEQIAQIRDIENSPPSQTP